MDYRDIDKYFRLVLDDTEADWTFVCPPDYRSIPGKRRRITQFYLDGFAAISQALQSLGLLVGIHIPAALAAILSRCPQNNPLKIQTGLLHCFMSGEGLFFIHQPPIPAGVPHHTLSAPGCPG
jgi:hypothetical protein